MAKHWNGQIVGCPGTIDNDLLGTDYTIGFATAVHTAVDALDKLRDTAESHERMFLVEVMGRHSGYIALYTALAGGAEVVAIPETHTDVPAIVKHLKTLKARGKRSIMVVVAEGDELGGAVKLDAGLKAGRLPLRYPRGPAWAICSAAARRCRPTGFWPRGWAISPSRPSIAAPPASWPARSAANLVLTPFEETYAQHKAVPERPAEGAANDGQLERSPHQV